MLDGETKETSNQDELSRHKAAAHVYNALPTNVNLRRRGGEIDVICVVCGEKEESVDHLFMNCKPVALFWNTLVLRIDMEKEPIKSFREWLWDKMQKYPMDYVGLLAYTVWGVWK